MEKLVVREREVMDVLAEAASMETKLGLAGARCVVFFLSQDLPFSRFIEPSHNRIKELEKALEEKERTLGIVTHT